LMVGYGYHLLVYAKEQGGSWELRGFANPETDAYYDAPQMMMGVQPSSGFGMVASNDGGDDPILTFINAMTNVTPPVPVMPSKVHHIWCGSFGRNIFRNAR
jgi:hypothetical protein